MGELQKYMECKIINTPTPSQKFLNVPLIRHHLIYVFIATYTVYLNMNMNMSISKEGKEVF